MSDDEMYEQEEVAPQKKGLPGWLWFCGGGCLIAVVLVIALLAWGISKGREMVDPEKQWPKVAEILPYDERPAELELQFGWDLGVDMFVFADSRGYAAVLMQLSKEQERDQMLDTSYEGGLFGMGGRKNLREGTISVQGRELAVVRFHQRKGEDGGGPDVGEGESAVVDLTPEGAAKPVLLQLVRAGGQGEITNDEIVTFLEPFHVGSER